jgi:hypothetical protein
MGFTPLMPTPPKPMDSRIFRDATMGIAPVSSLSD